MTENQWLTTINQLDLIKHVRPAASARKLRLCGCGTARLNWQWLTKKVFRRAIEVAERFADGEATAAQLDQAYTKAMLTKPKEDEADFSTERRASIYYSSKQALYTAAEDAWTAAYYSQREACNVEECGVVRDVFGNPFRPVTFDPRWRLADAVGVARAIYDERAFDADRMGVFCDALLDAGCDSADVLDHLRGPGPHVRGCWVVDLVLGKE
jgi:hypothetical protein